LTELRVAVRDLFAGIARSERGFLAGSGVHNPDERLVDRQLLEQDDLFVVGGPIGGLPAPSLELGEDMVGLGIGGIHYPEVSVFASAAGGHVGDAIAAGRPWAEDVAGLAVREERDLAGSEVVAMELVPLAAANVLHEDDVLAGIWLETAGGHGV